MSVLSDYRIRFQIADTTQGNWKTIEASNEVLSVFVHDNRLEHAKVLLNAIDKVLKDEMKDTSFTTRAMTEAVICKDMTMLYGAAYEYWSNESIKPDFALPTAHFKEILIAWVQFLEQED